MGCAPGFCVTSRLLSLFPPRRVENNYPLPQQLLQKHCLWFTCRRSARFANAKHHNCNSATNAAEAESPCFTRGLLKPLLPTAKLFRDQALVFFTHLSGRHNQARPFLPHLPSTACRLFLQGSVAARPQSLLSRGSTTTAKQPLECIFGCPGNYAGRQRTNESSYIYTTRQALVVTMVVVAGQAEAACGSAVAAATTGLPPQCLRAMLRLLIWIPSHSSQPTAEVFLRNAFQVLPCHYAMRVLRPSQRVYVF